MSLLQFLSSSQAAEPFRDAVRTFVRTGQPNERVSFRAYSPPVKVERTLIKLLEAHPELAIERVEVEATSGCEFFRGELRVHTAEETHRIHFHWDCKWKAMQQGWTDYFGFPDQTRAAQEFGHDCFRDWEVQVAELAMEAEA